MDKPSFFIECLHKITGLLLGGLLFLVLSGTALAANHNSQQPTSNNETPEQASGKALSLSNAYRASKLIGTTVKNTKGDDLGKISELVIEGSGQIKYAVLSHGGVLNMGAKMTAVSWKLFQISPMSNDENHNSVTLDINKDQLTDLPTFNEDSWPNRPQLTNLSSLNTQRMK